MNDAHVGANDFRAPRAAVVRWTSPAPGAENHCFVDGHRFGRDANDSVRASPSRPVDDAHGGAVTVDVRGRPPP